MVDDSGPTARRRGAILALTVAVAACAWLHAARPELHSFGAYFLVELLFLPAVGALALLPLGPGAFRASLGGSSRVLWFLIAVAVTLAQFAVVCGLRVAGSPQWWIGPLSTVLLAPLFEEWLDRGVLWHACRRAFPTWVTVLFTSVVFTVSHGPGRVAHFPGLFVSGVILGFLRQWSGSLHPGLVAHSLWNALAIVTL